MAGPAQTLDPKSLNDLLNRWLGEIDAEQAGQLFNELILGAEPIIRRIVAHKLRHGGDYLDTIEVDDVTNSALLNLISRLNRLAHISDRSEQAIQDFADYTAKITFNCCYEYWRGKHPERNSLANQLRYLLKHSQKLDLWRSSDNVEVCGSAQQRGQEPRPTTDSLHETLRGLTESRLNEGFLASVFHETGGPLEFDTLVDKVTEALGMKTRGAVPLDLEPPGVDPPIDRILWARQYLERLWTAILELPLHQRRALLLNMKDSNGGDVAVFDAAGIASIAQLAKALEIPTEEFAGMWKDLPIDDKRIAALCGIGVQDVVNRRSSGRRTLKNRMKDLHDEK